LQASATAAKGKLGRVLSSDSSSSQPPADVGSGGLSGHNELAGVRIGVPRGAFFDDLDPQVEAVVEAALDRMRRAGALLIEVDFGSLPTPQPIAATRTSEPESPSHRGGSAEASGLPSLMPSSSPLHDGAADPVRSAVRGAIRNAAHPFSLVDGVFVPLLGFEAPRTIATYLYTHSAPPSPPRSDADDAPEYDADGNPVRRKAPTASPIPLDSVLSVSAVVRSFAGPAPEKTLLQDQLDARTATSSAAYRAALVHRRPALKQQFLDYFAKHTVAAIVYPTTPLAAAHVRGSGAGAHPLVLHNGELVDAEALYSRNTRAASAAGLPCLSVPAGVTRPRAGALKKTTAGERLPVSLEFVMPAGADVELLALGAAFQRLQSFLPDPVVMARWGEGLTHFTQAP
jgi:Asp-tRNA(Asn)/Glu-tRNA(Gln) amidotransferase A subunit family amidase